MKAGTMDNESRISAEKLCRTLVRQPKDLGEDGKVKI
jgi:hypothetical protein